MYDSLQATSAPVMISRSTLTERLSSQKLDCENRLKEINDILDLLQQNPAIQQVMDKLSKIGGY